MDVLSIGSHSRIIYLKTQDNLFASSLSVRRFIKATEQNDFDRTCSSQLKEMDVQDIKRFCRKGLTSSKNDTTVSSLKVDPAVLDFSQYFLPTKMMRKKDNTASWLCAQQRPLAALELLVRSYQEAQTTENGFPDYLVIIDDDTYINPQKLRSLIRDYEVRHGTSSDDRVALAGCKARLRTIEFAHGGFGLILSRGAILALNDPFLIRGNDAIQRMLHPWVGNLALQSGRLSLLEIFSSIAKHHSFMQHRLWSFPGYCMHSDWVFAYILHRSHIATIDQLTPSGYCNMSGDECLASLGNVDICHSTSSALMQKLHERQKDRERS
ncbi:Fringe-like protein [Nitzschia inconspicua]|uniref:Fringe-like protein n=1 Tax=Nitzschia inconspicua TaxID=303405 RepID=A0A9K3Q0E2_9STRA|nr:Fringe-like protein [Nitzschia inconspicua]